jgi:hypothetical protein
MPLSPEEFRIYQEERRIRFLAIARERLGGKCSYLDCNEIENLEFDHIVPGSKVRRISTATNWSLKRFLAEVDKCQLLCRKHHQQKTTEAGEHARGERSGNAKLTEDDVRLIRKSPLPSRKLAEQYKISKTVVQKIKRHEAWKHVDELD